MHLLQKKNNTTALIKLGTMIFALLALSAVFAQDMGWPRDINTPEGVLTIYQPQVETFKGDQLTSRAAVSIQLKGKEEPVFGAVWTNARVSTDRDARLVRILDIKVPNVKFPNIKPDQEKQLAALLETHIPKWDLTISLDRLLAGLDLVEKEQQAAQKLNNTPPKIIFTTYPAVLVFIDGEPQLQKVEKSTLMRIVNTPFFIVLDPDSKKYYLKGDDEWFTASDIKGTWKETPKPPASVEALAAAGQQESQTRQTDAAKPTGNKKPKIIVSTAPTELIVSDGKPKYSPITGNELLYMSNTESDVFMEIATQKYFVLLSGRWYHSGSMEGPWTYVSPDQLPAGFAQIPAGSDKEHVLASVPGTQEAKEAVLDSQIPQTSAINRKEATLTVTYDGKLKFE